MVKRVLIKYVINSSWKFQVWLQKCKKNFSNCEVAIYSDIVPDPSVEVVADGIKKLQSCNAQL